MALCVSLPIVAIKKVEFDEEMCRKFNFHITLAQ